ncbi:MAG: fumarylacetoacetate hydrolase family protein [Nanoarchaeota archaeon]|nr:fumarylacetoacetate hydrolase family protein [Nanoarchaeota archaeon]MBU1703794.1 fumarylacetoacetate hydrolase family protein [Nanoarchaeota archaeon]
MPKPSKIICVGLNYKKHAKEMEMELPNVPLIFLKPNTSVIYGGDDIIYPSMSKRVDYEAELAMVIRCKCKNISKKDVRSYVKGFICLNDVTARDLQHADGQWTRAKSFDTFCPISSKVVPWDKVGNPNNLEIKAILNGKVVQDSSTSDFIFDVETVVSHISHIMTLLPGDIITTGTPEGIGPMKKGDKIEVRIERVGSLVNHVI